MAEPRTKRKQKPFFAGVTRTREVADGSASFFQGLCVVAGCCGLAQKGSPDVGEKWQVNLNCRVEKKKELEKKPFFFQRLHFSFPVLVLANKGDTKQRCQSVTC